MLAAICSMRSPEVRRVQMIFPWPELGSNQSHTPQCAETGVQTMISAICPFTRFILGHDQDDKCQHHRPLDLSRKAEKAMTAHLSPAYIREYINGTIHQVRCNISSDTWRCRMTAIHPARRTRYEMFSLCRLLRRNRNK